MHDILQKIIRSVLPRRIQNLLAGESRRFLLGGIGSVGVRGANIGLQFLVTIVLARYLGAEGFGDYSLVFATVTLTTMLAQFGLPILVMRETSKAHDSENWSLLKGFWTWSFTFAGALSLVILGVGSLIVLWWPGGTDSTQLWIYGFILGGLTSILNVNGAILIGLGYTVMGQITTLVLRPGLFLLFVLLASAYWAANFQASQAMGLYVVALVCSIIVSAVLLGQRKPVLIERSTARHYDTIPWLKAMLPLSLTEGLLQINLQAGVIMLGFFASAADIGIYRLAAQLAMMTLVIRMATMPLIAPQIALFKKENDSTRLQKLITIQSRVSFLAALFITLIYIYSGSAIVEFTGGQEFADAYLSLIILTIGYAVSIYFGPGDFFLAMTGFERTLAIILGLSVLLNLLLIIILVPLIGIEGAALALVISMVFRTIAIAFFAKRLTGMNICAF